MFKPKPSKPVLFAITFKQISALKGIALVVFLSFVFGIVYVFSATPLTASAATTNTINFQARLETAAGGIVTDGTYNVEFKIYNTLTSSGSSQGSCTGDAHCLWTEDYLVSASQGVAVSNGYMTVNLGSITAFPSTIPWGTPLYLTINIGGTGTPSWDGEMAPRLALTAVPAAFSLESAAGSYTSTLTFQQPTASESIYLPAEAGATNYVCYQNDTNCGFESTTGTNFIQNQNASAQTANYDITGEGQVGTLDAEGTGTANILTIGSSASTTGSIKIANTATSGSVIIGGTATTGTITVGEYDGASTNTIDIGDGATTGTQTINIGAAAGSGGTNNITIGSSTSTSQTKLQAGATTATLTNTEDTIGNTAGSATAFQVQNASGNDVLTVDTTTTNQPQGEVLLGKLSTNNGALAFANSSNGNTLTLTGNTSAAGNDAITLPTAGAVGNLCLQSSSASTASATTLQWGSCGGGGGSTTTLQQAYNNSAGATPNIDVQGTGGSDPYGGVTIQDDNSHGVTTGNNLFSVNAGAGSGLGSTLFGVNTYGDSTITSSDTSGTALNTTGTDISTGDVATFTTPLTGGSIDDLTSGNVVNITSASNAQSSAGALLNVSDTATLATNAGSDTGSLVNISRALTADVGGSGAETVSSPVASISNNCTLTAGTCTDATSVLSLNQQYSNATGNVLNIQDSGSGDAMNVTANSVTSGVGNNQTYNGLTTGDGMDLTTTSAAQSGSGALLNVSDTATLATNSGSDTGDLLNISRSITANEAGSTSTPTVDTSAAFHNDSLSFSSWTTGSFTVGTHSNRYLIIGILDESQNGAAPSSVKWGGSSGQSMTQLGITQEVNDEDYDYFMTYWVLLAPNEGSSTFYITPGTSDYEAYDVVADSWYNVNQSTPYGSYSPNLYTDGSGNASLSATSANGHVVVDMVGMVSEVSPSLTKGSSQTLTSSYADTSLYLGVGSSYEQATSSPTNMSWTLSSNGGWAEDAVDLEGVNTGTETVSSPVATISNNCTLTLGTCTDASNLLDLNQQYTNSSGAVLLIQNAGTGDMLDIENGSNVVLDKFSNNGSLTLGQSGGTSTAANVSLLTLGIDTNSTEPSEVNGAMYYNSNLGEFRCGLGGSWVSCINGTVASLVTNTATDNAANFNPTADYVYFTPLYIPGPMTVNSLRIYIANTDSDTGDIGLYNSAGQLVLDAGSGNLSLASTGLLTIAPTQTGSARNLPGGQYYMAVTVNSTTSNDPFYSAPFPNASAGPVFEYTGNITSGGGVVLPSSITLSSISAGANLLYMGLSN